MEKLPSVPINWQQELQGAKMLLDSGLAPRDLKSPQAALFCILAGRDLGLSPVQSLRSIRPIQGKIELSADLQLALFAREGGKFKWRRLADDSVSLELHAPWLVEPHVSTWTMEDAKRAALAGGDNWKRYPRAMLRSRAITAGLKDIGFLQGSGVYAPGEISGKAVVDQETMEVLPTEDVVTSEVAQMPVPQQTSPGDGALAGLDEALALRVMDWQIIINDNYDQGLLEEAYAKYKKAKEALAGDADAQVALRKGLSSKCRNKLLEMSRDEIRNAGIAPQAK